MPGRADKRKPLTRVAVALVRHGLLDRQPLDKSQVLRMVGLPGSTFRTHARDLGGRVSPQNQQLRFFAALPGGKLSFGPGAGLALGISVGTSSMRAQLVDANGWCYYAHEAEPDPKQLERTPEGLFRRVRGVASAVLQRALDDDDLVVEEFNEEGQVVAARHVPLLGWAIAWPTPVSRSFQPLSQSLRSSAWRNLRLDEEAKRYLGSEVPFSYALNDAAAAAIAVAHEQTHSKGYDRWTHPRLAMVLRLGGGVGSASIIVEDVEHRPNDIVPELSGFPESVLIGGIDKCAGEIGHMPVRTPIIDELNDTRPPGLPRIVGLACSCVRRRAVTDHLESFTSAKALAARVEPDAPLNQVLARLREDPSDLMQRAMQDIGSILGEALVGPIAALNPATLTLTGSMATADVAQAIRDRLDNTRGVASLPDTRHLEGDANRSICSKGAALALIRREVHRKVGWLLGEEGGNPAGEANTYLAKERVRNLTFRYVGEPLRPGRGSST